MSDASQFWTPTDSFQGLNTLTILLRLVDEAKKEREKAESRLYDFLRDYHAAQIAAFVLGDYTETLSEKEQALLAEGKMNASGLWADLMNCGMRSMALMLCDISEFKEQILDRPQAEAFKNKLLAYFTQWD